MNFRNLLTIASISLTGCTLTQSTVVSTPKLPTCGEIYQILQYADSEFNELKSGPQIRTRETPYPYWSSSIALPESDGCAILEKNSSNYEFRCSWSHGDDNASMGQHYQALRDKVISCVGDVKVRRNDLKGYTVIYLEPTSQLSQLQYWIRARYEVPPYRVIFDIETEK
ncbi:hypothetical protein D3C73_995290 [compost metagenome]